MTREGAARCRPRGRRQEPPALRKRRASAARKTRVLVVRKTGRADPEEEEGASPARQRRASRRRRLLLHPAASRPELGRPWSSTMGEVASEPDLGEAMGYVARRTWRGDGGGISSDLRAMGEGAIDSAARVLFFQRRRTSGGASQCRGIQMGEALN